MTITVVTPPAEIISLAAAKAHLRVLHASEDALIAALITTARQHLEGIGVRGGILGRSIAAQTLRLALDTFPPGTILLRRGPIRAVTAITYTDADGAAATLATSAIKIDHDDDRAIVSPVSVWPAGATAVRVTYDVGYLECPAPLRHAMLLLIQQWYDQRAAAGARQDALPFAVEALLMPYQTHGWI